MNISEKQIKKNVSSSATPVLREEKDGVVTLTLNRPKQFNAISERMLKQSETILMITVVKKDIVIGV